MIRNRAASHKSSILILLVGFAVVFSVACTATGSPTNTPTPAPSPTKTTSVSPVSPVGSPGSTTMNKVILTEYKVGLEKSTVNSGPVRFEIRNDGSAIHVFEITGRGIDQKTVTLQPGDSTTMDVTLTAGDYEVWCPISGHKAQGMTTTLTVQ